jgi:hypothetical protein
MTNGKGKLFEYAVLYHPKPTKEQNDRGETPKSVVLIEPRTVLAMDESQAAMLAARAIPETHVEKLDDVEICVRPF